MERSGALLGAMHETRLASTRQGSPARKGRRQMWSAALEGDAAHAAQSVLWLRRLVGQRDGSEPARNRAVAVAAASRRRAGRSVPIGRRHVLPESLGRLVALREGRFASFRNRRRSRRARRGDLEESPHGGVSSMPSLAWRSLLKRECTALDTKTVGCVRCNRGIHCVGIGSRSRSISTLKRSRIQDT